MYLRNSNITFVIITLIHCKYPLFTNAYEDSKSMFIIRVLDFIRVIMYCALTNVLQYLTLFVLYHPPLFPAPDEPLLQLLPELL